MSGLSIARASTPLANQVAGHQNVMSDESGSLVIKPALPREIAFYQLINGSDRSSPLSRLRPFVAKFFGTLRLEGRLEPDGGVDADIPGVAEVPESVVLENLAHAYTHPSILDVKLGTVLYSPEATKEKRERMEKQARESTSLETGVRLTGCQTWHAPSQSYILTPKSFGKNIRSSELPIGIARFFPLSSDVIPGLVLPASPPPNTSASSTFSEPSHLPLPPAPTASSASAPPEPRTPLSGNMLLESYSSHAIRAKLLVRVLSLLDEHLAVLETVLKPLEARFTGSSVLVVYEGDPDRLADAMDKWDTRPRHSLFATALNAALEEDEEDESDLEEDSTSSEDDSLDGTRADARVKRRCPPLTVRLIDFAHTRLVEGEGPDLGVLKGLSTLRALVQGRKKEAEACLTEVGSVTT